MEQNFDGNKRYKDSNYSLNTWKENFDLSNENEKENKKLMTLQNEFQSYTYLKNHNNNNQKVFGSKEDFEEIINKNMFNTLNKKGKNNV